MRCARLLLLLWFVALPALSAPAGAAEEAGPPTIYKWVDENGIAHYTTDRRRIPKGLRDRFEPEAEAEEPPSASQSVPALPPPPTPAPQAAVPPEPPALTEPMPTPSATEVASPIQTSPAIPEAAPPRPAVSEPEEQRPVVAEPPAETPATIERAAAASALTDPAVARPGADGPAGETPALDERDFGAESEFLAAERAPDLDEQIRRLEDEIQADEEALKALLAAPPGASPLAVADDGDLRAIAERLPERLGELDALRAQRRSAEPH